MKRFLKRFPLYWETYDWSLNIVNTRYPNGDRFESRSLFQLLCCECRRFTFGCHVHWFCGLCRPCEAARDKE